MLNKIKYRLNIGIKKFCKFPWKQISVLYIDSTHCKGNNKCGHQAFGTSWIKSDNLKGYSDVFNMTGIAFNLPVFACAPNHRKLKTMSQGFVNKMIDQIRISSFINRFSDFMNAIQNRFRIFISIFFKQSEGFVYYADIFIKTLIFNEISQSDINIMQSPDMDGKKPGTMNYIEKNNQFSISIFGIMRLFSPDFQGNIPYQTYKFLITNQTDKGFCGCDRAFFIGLRINNLIKTFLPVRTNPLMGYLT